MTTADVNPSRDGGKGSVDGSAASSSSSSSSSSSVPKAMAEFNLHSSIKWAVDMTNDRLARVERATDDASASVLSHVRSVGRQASHLATRAMSTYDVGRRDYGPHIVGGSALVIGGLVAARRGRIPGALAGTVAGLGSYAAVSYDGPVYRVDKESTNANTNMAAVAASSSKDR